jgi:hypothetical protein
MTASTSCTLRVYEFWMHLTSHTSTPVRLVEAGKAVSCVSVLRMTQCIRTQERNSANIIMSLHISRGTSGGAETGVINASLRIRWPLFEGLCLQEASLFATAAEYQALSSRDATNDIFTTTSAALPVDRGLRSQTENGFNDANCRHRSLQLPQKKDPTGCLLMRP